MRGRGKSKCIRTKKNCKIGQTNFTISLLLKIVC